VVAIDAYMATNPTDRWTQFLARVHELKDIDGILALLSWDEETYAPNAGRAARGQQTATLEAIRHQRLVEPALGDLIAALAEDRALTEAQRMLVKRAKRKRDLATKVPESLVKALAETRSVSLAAWQSARADKKYPAFLPHLKDMLRLLREKADAIGWDGGERYDALLDEYEPEMRVSALRPVLEELRKGLVPIAEAILANPKPDKAFLEAPTFDVEKQWAFSLRLLRDMGFDFAAGRQDRSAHPFTSASSERDVRTTIRLYPNNPLSAVFSAIHEAGHALYEQGFAIEHYRTYLAEAPSMGIHESQSRLWENQIGRSRAFWQHYLPPFRDMFPAEMRDIGLEKMYRAVNIVEATPIRVEADEVTYNLHILVRFELEVALLSGDLAAEDLPEVWGAKMKQYLGIVPKDDAEGCLQDIHWAWGAIGYFPTYTIGNLYAAQLLAAYERDHPGLWTDVEHGRLAPLLHWLRDRVHSRGHLKSAVQTIRDATHQDLSVTPFLDYLRKKYGELYKLA
jgi:carboxypeptidase Taq